jgi:hypothetical protein
MIFLEVSKMSDDVNRQSAVPLDFDVQTPFEAVEKPEPMVILTNAEFVRLVRAAGSDAEEVAKQEVSLVSSDVQPKMEEIESQVSAVHDSIRALEQKVHTLDQGLRTILGQTGTLISSMRRNDVLLTVFYDSAQLGLINLDALPKNIRDLPRIEAVHTYLDKAVRAFQSTRQ